MHFLHIMLQRNIFTCHNIIAFHSILIARMVKSTSKTRKTFQARLGSLAKASTKGKERPTSSKILLHRSATNKRRVEDLHPISLILLLPVLTATLILLLTKIMMLSWLVIQIIPSYLHKSCNVKLLMMI